MFHSFVSLFNVSLFCFIVLFHCSMFHCSLFNVSLFCFIVLFHCSMFHSFVSLFNVSLFNVSLFNVSLFNVSLFNVSLFNVSLFNVSLFNVSLFNVSLFNVSLFNVSLLRFKKSEHTCKRRRCGSNVSKNGFEFLFMLGRRKFGLKVGRSEAEELHMVGQQVVGVGPVLVVVRPLHHTGKGRTEVDRPRSGHQEDGDAPHGQAHGLPSGEVTEGHQHPLLHEPLTVFLHAPLKHLKNEKCLF